MPVLSSQEWDEFLAEFPNVHILQTARWGQLKRKFGWEVARIREGSTGVQILFRRIYILTIAYVPKGPVGDDWNQLLPSIHKECKKRRAILLAIEPDTWEIGENQTIQSILRQKNLVGFRSCDQTIQPRRTIVVDLNRNDDQIISAMKQKTRYNIHLAERKGVQVRISSDLAAFNKMMQVTGNRDNFSVHHANYYETAFRLFEPQGKCALLIAYYNNEPLAGLLIFRQGSRAWYFYGASSDQHREFMPAYLLQWEAIKWAKTRGCHSYDLWGVPDQDESSLEANFMNNSDGLWGVYRFKRGFGGELKRAVAPFEFEYMPALCRLYRYFRRTRGLMYGS